LGKNERDGERKGEEGEEIKMMDMEGIGGSEG